MFDYRDVLDSEGLVARRRQGYERRDAQLAMAAEVDAAIRARTSLAIEAGTGVGKSFAYLTPAILYAVEDQVRQYDPNFYFEVPDDEEDQDPSTDAPQNAAPADSAQNQLDDENMSVDDEETKDALKTRRVVVSTHTISLQEQLYLKDIPFLNSILPFEFSTALAKGRSNYLCRRRFASAARAIQQGTFLEDSRLDEIRRIAEWLKTTADGSKSELDPPVSEEVWNEVNCELGNCLGKKCKYRNTCFFAQARSRLEKANIIVVNHALLFSDLALENGSILPNYDVLIFDEAHTMEEVASENLGIEITQASVEYLLTRLYNDRTGKGLLVDELIRSKFNQLLVRALQDAEERVVDCRIRTDSFFEALRDWLDDRPDSNGRVLEKNIVPRGLVEGLDALRRRLQIAADLIEDDGRRQEFVAASFRVTSYIAALDDWLGQKAAGFAYWLERRNSRAGVRIALKAAPIDVAGILRTRLFEKVPVVVATSATLTTGAASATLTGVGGVVDTNPVAVTSREESEQTRRAFSFFRRRVGFSGFPVRALGSPYRYRDQMTLVLARGLKTTADLTPQGLEGEKLKEYNERRLWSAIRDYIDESDGGAFVLFTNAQQMKRATDAMEEFFAQRRYPFYSQSGGVSRNLMVERFKESNRSVLFGVDSFWQGVDVPGDALRNVIIVKFPFLSPGSPLVEAKIQAIEDARGSGFRDYLLPMAILKFKQGVGRLIRTHTDSGMVVLLDERVHTKSYGREFLRALPDCKLRIDEFQP